MTDFVFLKQSDAYRFNIEIVSRAVESVASMLMYKGACMYLPSPDGDKGKVLLVIDEKTASQSETEWFLAHLAGYLEAELYSSDGSHFFADSPESDLSFFESLPPPENEAPMIRLFFSFDTDGVNDDVAKRLVDFFDEYGYEVNPESDGMTVYLAANSYLDIFITEDGRITGEIDCTFSGAGVYSQVVELAEAASKSLSLPVSFVEPPFITYTADGDFDKLRQEFYPLVKQQLAFAFNDDRDGIQAYYGWGTDAFEVEYRPGTLVTSLGRYELDTLKTEILRYGFSYTCDHRLLTRNTPSKCADSEYKEVLNIMWNTSVGGRDSCFNEVESDVLLQCFGILEETYDRDPFAAFPIEIYNRIGRILKREVRQFTHIHELDLHYQPGYMSEDVFFGFGHYLRRVKLPGYLSRDEFRHGFDVCFVGTSADDLIIECEIVYGYEGDGSESVLGQNFAIGDDVKLFDIGGTAMSRYVRSQTNDGKWRAEAEIFIKDEIYRFAATAGTYDGISVFCDAMIGALNVEDWYDEAIKEDIPDPHANGATFCVNGTVNTSGVYRKQFPVRIGMLGFPLTIVQDPTLSNDPKEAFKYMMEMFEKYISEKEKNDGEENKPE